MFSRTSLNSLLKVSPTYQGKENWNLLSRGVHMFRDFQTVGQAMPGDDVRWLFDL